MISLHAGRLLLVCRRSDRRWHAVVKLGPKPEHQVEADTGVDRLQDALQLAEAFYREAVASIRPDTAAVMCWDCLQWNVQANRCELAIPEAKRSGGRYAPHCEMYSRAIG